MSHRLLLSSAIAVLVASSAGAGDAALTLDLGDDVKMELVLVKKGSFTQGSPKAEPGRADDEAERKVTLTRDFYAGKYPVTRGQFARFVKDAKYQTEAERGASGGFGWDGEKLVQKKQYTWRNPGFEQGDDHPVVIVTYDDARAFCAWLTKKAGREVTLPTEAQWEYACRADTATRYYNGDDAEKLSDIAWYQGNAGNGTRAVGKKNANAWGLHDMSGNVFEWCRDWYGPYRAGPVEDPEEKSDKLSDPPRRVLRGGSWLRETKFCRSAARYRNTPASRNADNGFRVVAATEATADKKEPNSGMSPSGGPPFAMTDPPFAVVEIACSIVVAAIMVAVIVYALRNLGARGAGSSGMGQRPMGPNDVVVREADDGFWLQLHGVEAGSQVRYRCRVDGQDQSGSIEYEPGPQGHFIYTGGRPTGVQVTGIIHPTGLPLLPPGQSRPTSRPWPATRPPRSHQPPPVVHPPPQPPPAY
jgi:formylglycine-generating enzyme required for sulfatase activity